MGQPLLVPGDMGRGSYVLVGKAHAMAETFGSACHGAGRALSRRAARAASHGRNITDELHRRGVTVMTDTPGALGEEMPAAYKDVDRIVDVCERAGLARRVARLAPLGCLKG